MGRNVRLSQKPHSYMKFNTFTPILYSKVMYWTQSIIFLLSCILTLAFKALAVCDFSLQLITYATDDLSSGKLPSDTECKSYPLFTVSASALSTSGDLSVIKAGVVLRIFYLQFHSLE